MKERPILFSAPMVRAILEGRKTQTRRILKPGKFVLPSPDVGEDFQFNGAALVQTRGLGTSFYPLPFCPYGVRGDRLWVRERFAPNQGDERPWCAYYADCEDPLAIPRWKPSIHMRRNQSRLLLEVIDVRVQRLQTITEEDARAEGINPLVFMASGTPQAANLVTFMASGTSEPSYRAGFEIIWCDINGRASWDANPWVWVISFRRVRP
jgi:hypothetical protein